MDNEIVIETLKDEINRLNRVVALGFMQATEEDKKLAEELFYEQQARIKNQELEIQALRKSRDAFQLDNRKLKRRIAALEGKC
ncbi:MAG: hypothetical protein RL563_2658 [Pseudomonadota bacterium]|jgi:hypothetical protein